MLITNWKLEEKNNTLEVSADVDGFRLWYKVPASYQVSKAADPFMAAALIPAMLEGEKLDVDPGLTVSPGLMTNLLQLQEIYHSWNPRFKIIQINAITANTRSLNNSTFSFFSGGVDSLYTFLKRLNEISHVVFIQGFDFYGDSQAYERAIKRNTDFVQNFGKTLVPVETNYYPFGYRYNLSRNLTQGSCLGSVALLLAFQRVYIPSAFSYNQLMPLGSHPLTDPLWGNENIKIFHDGCEATRTEKLKKICQNKSALSNLTVCLNDMNKNCGNCAKCFRTMISLKLIQATSEAFPPLPSLKVIKKKRIQGEIEEAFLKESVDFAIQEEDYELKNALCTSLRRHQKLYLYKEIDRIFLNGLLLKVYRRIMKKESGAYRIDTLPMID